MIAFIILLFYYHHTIISTIAQAYTTYTYAHTQNTYTFTWHINHMWKSSHGANNLHMYLIKVFQSYFFKLGNVDHLTLNCLHCIAKALNPLASERNALNHTTYVIVPHYTINFITTHTLIVINIS